MYENELVESGRIFKEPIETISLRSSSVNEIISRRPGFLEKWALVFFLVILVFLFAGTWVIKYPDIIQASAILTADDAPKEIVAHQDGKLINLFVSNDNFVEQGKTIAWIESTASHKDVIILSNLLDRGAELLSKNEIQKVSELFKVDLQNLGELQTFYQQFISSLQQFNDYLVNGYYYQRENVLYEDMGYLKKIKVSLEEEKEIIQQDLILSKEDFDANNSLFNDKVVSKQDLREKKSKLLSKQLTLPQLESNLLTNENLQVAKQKEINELQHTISLQKIIFQQALQTLLSITNDWKKKYIITAPVSGKIVFSVPLQKNQYIHNGKIIGFVNPPDSSYYAQIMLPQNNFGKIEIGQKVKLRLDAYPYQEFGFIPGKLSYISNVPSDSGFLAIAELTNGLSTNYKKIIQYRSGLKLQAVIVTKDSRLLQRFYYSIVKETTP